jgi:HAE1 family hydrophobic/amphiphilic exporter-1
MRYITSSSGNDGVSSITITFEPSRDIDVGAVDVQNRVNRASAHLPAQVNQTGIVVNKASNQLLMSFGVFSPDERYDTSFISNYADVNLKDPLKRIRGVGEVRIFGERKFSMRLWLDPTELARRRLTAQDVTRALQEQNLQVAAGQVGQPPSTPGQTYQIAVRARGRLIEPAEFDEIVVQRGSRGEVVRIRDVGKSELGAESYGQLLRFGGKAAVGLGIFQHPGRQAWAFAHPHRSQALAGSCREKGRPDQTRRALSAAGN